MCSKYKCSYFAVTTYEFWTFGNFTSSLFSPFKSIDAVCLADRLIAMENAYISDLFGAPVHPHGVQVRRHMLPSPSMTEVVLFWMAASMGIEGIDWIPFDDKAS